MLKLFHFLRWKFIDIKREIKKKDKLPGVYGVWLYVGLPGRGKTVSMVDYLYRMKKKWGSKIKIYTNFSFELEDGPITHWKDLINISHDVPIIFALDEVQLTFNSRNWKDFPSEMVTLLTQNRKMKKQLICSAQSFERVDKVFRELTHFVIECRTLAGRWTFQRAFETVEYMKGQESVKGRKRVRAWRYSFIQTDYLRSLYDTMKRLDSLIKQEYLSDDERKIKQLLNNI